MIYQGQGHKYISYIRPCQGFLFYYINPWIYQWQKQTFFVKIKTDVQDAPILLYCVTNNFFL
jgi:hypothetical protein